ncbi:hypothetical protein [Planococcus sp. ISL-109]|nr:hypothetical protein [Planococcus sp. ISL-109]
MKIIKIDCAWLEPEGAELLLANYEDRDMHQLKPYEARVYKLRN